MTIALELESIFNVFILNSQKVHRLHLLIDIERIFEFFGLILIIFLFIKDVALYLLVTLHPVELIIIYTESFFFSQRLKKREEVGIIRFLFEFKRSTIFHVSEQFVWTPFTQLLERQSKLYLFYFPIFLRTVYTG